MYYWPIKFINRLFRFSNENKTRNSEKYSRIQIGEINRTQHDIKNVISYRSTEFRLQANTFMIFKILVFGETLKKKYLKFYTACWLIANMLKKLKKR